MNTKKLIDALWSDYIERNIKMKTEIDYDAHNCLQIAGYFVREDASMERRAVRPSRFTIWARKVMFHDIYISLLN